MLTIYHKLNYNISFYNFVTIVIRFRAFAWDFQTAMYISDDSLINRSTKLGGDKSGKQNQKEKKSRPKPPAKAVDVLYYLN